MIPKLDSPETLRVLSLIVGGMKSLHLLLTESGFNITYATLSKYISNGVQFEEKVFANLFETIRKKATFNAREAARNLEDAYVIVNELVGQGVIFPKKMGDDLDEDWQKRQTLTSEEIKDFEAEFGTKLSLEQKEVLQGKRRKKDDSKPKPKSSVSVDDLFGDDDNEEDVVVMVRNEQAEVIAVPTKREEPEEPKKEENKSDKNFLEDFLNGEDDTPPPRNALTDPFEAELRKTPDVFTSEDHRF